MTFKNPKRIWIFLVVLWVAACLLVLTGSLLFGWNNVALAADKEDIPTHEMFVICQPNDYINVRSKPSRKSSIEGFLLNGYSVMVTDQIRNHFIYCPEVTVELGYGWVHAGYLVNDPPVDMEGAIYRINANGRVAARKYINGPRRCWLYNGDVVKVWYMTDMWCVTNRGFIMTRYLEVDTGWPDEDQKSKP